MALSFNTGMTLVSNANSATNWAGVGLSGTTWKTLPALDTSTAAVGTGCISGADWSASSSYAMLFDYYTQNASTTLNLTTAGNEVISLWFQGTPPSMFANFSAGGIYIIATSSADTGTTTPTAYSQWYVSGADLMENTRVTTKGVWFLVMIDTRKTASASTGTPNLAAVRRLGVGFANNAAPPAPKGSTPPSNAYCGGLWYGRPRYQVIGDGSTTANWASLQTNSLTTNQDGLNVISGRKSVKNSCRPF